MNNKQLKEIALKYKLSNRDIGQGTGYNHQYVSSVLCGNSPLTRNFAHKMREYLKRVCIPFEEEPKKETTVASTAPISEARDWCCEPNITSHIKMLAYNYEKMFGVGYMQSEFVINDKVVRVSINVEEKIEEE